MKEINYFEAVEVKAQCPYCKKWLDGWIGDPRGQIGDCEFCGKKFKVADDIDIDISW